MVTSQSRLELVKAPTYSSRTSSRQPVAIATRQPVTKAALPAMLEQETQYQQHLQKTNAQLATVAQRDNPKPTLTQTEKRENEIKALQAQARSINAEIDNLLTVHQHDLRMQAQRRSRTRRRKQIAAAKQFAYRYRLVIGGSLIALLAFGAGAGFTTVVVSESPASAGVVDSGR